MQKTSALLCLAGIWFLFSSSAPTSIEISASAAALLEPAAAAAAVDIPSRTEAEQSEPLSGTSELAPTNEPLPDNNAPGESKDPRVPTSLERARAALAESNAPALSNNEICTNLVAVAQANALPIGFFANLIWRESRFDREAISKVGAMGIAQFMPAVA